MKKTLLAGCIALSLLPSFVYAKDTQLNYPSGHADDTLIPYPDNLLQTAQAQLWQTITEDSTLLEGPAFDSDGNLYLTDLYHGQIVKVDTHKKNTIIFNSKEYAPCSIVIRKDGKLVVAAVAFDGSKGKIFSINPDGSDIETIVSADRGFRPNDMVFDRNGGLYFTDASGHSGNPAGGVYYVSPDLKTVTPILKNLSGGNGIALSPDGTTLWVVEFSAGVLHRLLMQDATHIRAFGENVAYRFNGLVADSMKADSDGNLYIALHGQGRVIVLNKNATPIGQITLAGREQGQYLRSTNLAIKPGTREVYITTSNDEELKTGGAIFKASGFAPAISHYWQ